MALLSAAALHDALATLPHWQATSPTAALKARWKFADFAEALAFVNRVGALAEAANHHPDFKLGWGYVGIELLTHDAGGLTAKDIALATEISALFGPIAA